MLPNLTQSLCAVRVIRYFRQVLVTLPSHRSSSPTRKLAHCNLAILDEVEYVIYGESVGTALPSNVGLLARTALMVLVYYEDVE